MSPHYVRAGRLIAQSFATAGPVSIHVPREGGNDLLGTTLFRLTWFQFTRPARGATKRR
jgi:hypothetical protein